MNNRVLSFVLTFACASLVGAMPQEPPGCKSNTQSSKSHTKKQLRAAAEQKSEISGKLPRRDTAKTRKHKAATEDTERSGSLPFIASPIYLPSTGSGPGTAITASNGYLYVVVGQKLYKVSEKTLRTVQISALSKVDSVPDLERDTPSKRKNADSETPKRKKKVVARESAPAPRGEGTTLRRARPRAREGKAD